MHKVGLQASGQKDHFRTTDGKAAAFWSVTIRISAPVHHGTPAVTLGAQHPLRHHMSPCTLRPVRMFVPSAMPPHVVKT